MEEKIITLTIEKLAGLGDGVGEFQGQRIFMPYTLPGDVVRARIVHATKEAVHAAIEEIITPSAERRPPACRHFADCGGCSLQHMEDGAYRDFKQQMASEAVRKAGFDPRIVAPMLQLPTASRRRIEIKVANGRMGYYAERSHRLVDIEECKVLEPVLEALVLRLKPKLIALAGLASIQINGVDAGYDLLLHMLPGAPEIPDKTSFLHDEAVRRVSVKEASGPRTLHSLGPVTLTLGEVKVAAPPGAFMQASREAQERMTAYAVKAAKGSQNILDLFAGLGTYSFPLSRHANVTAIESDAMMVKAMRQAAVENKLTTFRAEARDLFQAPVIPPELAAFDFVVINPPRTGAKEQSIALAGSKIKKLVMISCNPATFARDARILKEGGFTLVHALPVDQFTYSSHLEILAEFTK